MDITLVKQYHKDLLKKALTLAKQATLGENYDMLCVALALLQQASASARAYFHLTLELPCIGKAHVHEEYRVAINQRWLRTCTAPQWQELGLYEADQAGMFMLAQFDGPILLGEDGYETSTRYRYVIGIGPHRARWDTNAELALPRSFLTHFDPKTPTVAVLSDGIWYVYRALEGAYYLAEIQGKNQFDDYRIKLVDAGRYGIGLYSEQYARIYSKVQAAMDALPHVPVSVQQHLHAERRSQPLWWNGTAWIDASAEIATVTPVMA